MLKPSWKKKVLIIAGLLGLGIPLLGQPLTAEVVKVYERGGNPEYPGEYGVDQNPATSWQPGGANQGGEVQILLNKPYLIKGLKIQGQFTQEAQIQVLYLPKGGGFESFMGGLWRTPANGEDYLDFSSQRIVSDSLMIRFKDPENPESRVSEMQIIGEDPEAILHKLIPSKVSASQNTSYFESEYHLVDGKPETLWKVESYPDWSKRHWAVVEYLKQAREYNREWTWGRGWARMDFDGGSSLQKLRYYVTPATRQNFVIEIKEAQKGWEEVRFSSQNSPLGWNDLILAGGPVEVESVRISGDIDWRNPWAGGLGEIEFWGTGNFPLTDSRDLGEPFDLKDPRGSYNAFFPWEKEQAIPRIEVALPESAPGEAVLNGFPLIGVKKDSFERYNLYEFPLSEALLIQGINIFELPSQGDGAYSIRLKQPWNHGEIPLSGAVLKEVEGEQILKFPQSLFLERLDSGEAAFFLGDEPMSGPAPFLFNSLKLPRQENGGDLQLWASLLPDGIPELTILHPSPGSSLIHFEGKGPNYRYGHLLMGQVDDPQGEILIEGRQPERLGSYFWIDLKKMDLPKSGAVDLTVTLKSSRGQTLERTISYFIPPPGHNIQWNQELSVLTPRSSFSFTGRANPWRHRLLINGQEYPLRGPRFSLSVPLSPGMNLFQVQFFNQKNNELIRAFTQRVFWDTTPLSLILSSPPQGLITPDGEIPLTGTLRGVGKTELSLDGAEIPLTLGRFNTPLTLTNGDNTFTLTATDEGGQSLTRKLRIFRDDEAPVITSLTPSEGTIFTTNEVTIGGEVQDVSPCKVFSRGHFASIPEKGRFLWTKELSDGRHKLIFYAVDQGGKLSAPRSRSIIVDTTPPEKGTFSFSPGPEEWSSQAVREVTFHAEDETSGIDYYEIQIDEGPFERAESPWVTPRLTEGIHKILVKAVDRAGWETTLSQVVRIDTIPPSIPEEIQGIPGRGNIHISWNSSEKDGASFLLKRDPSFPQGILPLEENFYQDKDLQDGKEYQYSVAVVDHAGNVGPFSPELIRISGLETEPYQRDEGAHAQYQNVTLSIPPGALPEETRFVEIKEILQAPEIMEKASVLVSPVFDFSLVDSSGDSFQRAVDFLKPYEGEIRYDESLIPSPVPEETLGVYVFDPTWGRWSLLEDYQLDTEENIIRFTSHHFSLYSVQATPVRDLDPLKVQNIGFSPLGTGASHDDLEISLHGGTTKTRAEDLALPGPYGFDFTWRRYYDQNLGDYDFYRKNNPWAHIYEKDQPDWAYTLASGWRLDIPHIMDAASDKQLVLPGGRMVSFTSMDLLEWEQEGQQRTLLFKGPRENPFLLYVEQDLKSAQVNTTSGNHSETIGQVSHYVLTMKNGLRYTLNKWGLTTEIESPGGAFKQTFTYQRGEKGFFQLKEIVDALGRTLYITYQGEVLQGFSVEEEGDTPSFRYHYQDDLLIKYVDPAMREWKYQYTPLSEEGGQSLSALEGPGTGIHQVEYLPGFHGNSGGYRASLIRVYPHRQAYDSGQPQSLTYIEADFDEYTRETGETESYLSQITKRRGRQEIQYHFDPYMAPRRRWEVDSEGQLQQLEAPPLEVVQTREVSYQKRSPFGEVYVTTTKEYEEPDSLPSRIITQKGTHTQWENLIHDSWGNIIERDQLNHSVTLLGGKQYGLSHRTQSKRTYLNPRDRGDLYPDFLPENTFSLDEEILWMRWDLPTAEEVTVYPPEPIEGTSSFLDWAGFQGDLPETVKQYKAWEYNDSLQITGSHQYDPERVRWVSSTTEYYPLEEGAGVKKRTSPQGLVVDYTYDEHYFLQKKTQTFQDRIHNDTGLLVSDEDQRITTLMAYDYLTGLKKWEQIPQRGLGEEDLKLKTIYQYDLLGRPLKILKPGDTPLSEGYTQTIQYDDTLGSLRSSIIDSLGRQTEFRYNDLGQLITMTQKNSIPGQPLNRVSRYTYNQWGRLSSYTDPGENTLHYQYDGNGNITTIEGPSQEGLVQTHRHWDYENRILTLINEKGSRKIIHFDGLERPVVKSEEGNNWISLYNSRGGLIGEKDPLGNWVTYGYNSLGYKTWQKLPFTKIWEVDKLVDWTPEIRYSYDLAGREIEILSRDGENLWISEQKHFDQMGRLLEQSRGTRTSLTGPYNKLWKETYQRNAQGLPLKIFDARGFFTQQEYSPRGNRVSHKDQSGLETRYQYYPDGSLKSLTPPQGIAQLEEAGISQEYSVVYKYDHYGQLIEAILPEKIKDQGRVHTFFTYNPLGNLLEKTDPQGRLHSYTYTPRNLLEEEKISGGGDSLSTEYRYDSTGQVSSMIDDLGETRFFYDSLGRLIKREEPMGQTYTFEYDSKDNLLAETDPEGEVTKYTYNNLGQLTRREQPHTPLAEGYRIFYYDRQGRLAREIDEGGRSRTLSYNSLGQQTEEISPLGYTSRFWYDPVGNLKAQKNYEGHLFSYEYTSNNQIKKIEAFNQCDSQGQPLGQAQDTILYTYDSFGILESIQNKDVLTQYDWDPYQRMTAKRQTIQERTLEAGFRYDKGDRITGFTFGDQGEISYQYNPLGQIISIGDYLKSPPVYLNGALQSYTRSNGIETRFQYNPDHSLKGLGHYGETPLKAYNYTYDQRGNITKMNQSLYHYDERNQLIGAHLSGSYKADPLGVTQDITQTDHDLFGQKSSEFPPDRGPQIIKVDYAGASLTVDLQDQVEITKIILTPELDETRVEPEDFRIFVSPTNQNGSYIEQQDFSAFYIQEGGRQKVQIQIKTLTKGRYVKILTDHNERDRDYLPIDLSGFYNQPEDLVVIHYNVSHRREKYQYDTLGNRSRQEVSLVNTEQQNYLYYPRTNRVFSDGRYFYQYDRQGNRVAKGEALVIEEKSYTPLTIPLDLTKTFADSTIGLPWDPGKAHWQYDFNIWGSLSRVIRQGEVLAEYYYDSEGYRIKSTHRDKKNKDTYYLFDTDGKLLYKEIDEEGSENTMVQRFLYWGEHLFAQESGIKGTSLDRYYLHTDHLGSVTTVTDDEGQVLWENEYLPYGELAREGSKDFAFFTGKEWDEQAGLYYFNARWYDPGTGRFISEDPARDGVNWFAYAWNNPLRFLDPTGLEVIDLGAGLSLDTENNEYILDEERIAKDTAYAKERNKFSEEELAERRNIALQKQKALGELRRYLEDTLDDRDLEYMIGVLERGEYSWNGDYFFIEPGNPNNISSNFGAVKYNSEKEKYYPHGGTDYPLTPNSVIRSVANGIIVEVGEDSLYGKFVTVMHKIPGSKLKVATKYGHLNSSKVKIGANVGIGQTLGHSGNTGDSTGPHLHFEVIVGRDRAEQVQFSQSGKIQRPQETGLWLNSEESQY